MERTMQFKELKKYLSRIDRYSVCILNESLSYENYRWLRDIPDKYDDMYVVGIGRIESEFEEDAVFENEKKGNAIGNGQYFADCIEIVVSEIPVKDTPDTCCLSEYCHIWTRFPKRAEDFEGDNDEEE